MISATLPGFERLHELRGGALVVPASNAVFRISGPGVVACMQGLWTNDLQDPGDDTITYGALLTPKGMIVTDGWAVRTDVGLDLFVPLVSREAVADIFRRSLPPRLASASDMTDSTRVLYLIGDAAVDRWPVLPLGRLPEPGTVATGESAAVPFRVATPVEGPFEGIVFGPVDAVRGVETLLEAAGMQVGSDDDREAARVLAGWPAVGAEIDERTLPQEVRFDEHAGVSYTKGCYTGQETVARLHFRGHANRLLRGLRWIGPRADGDEVKSGGKVVGRVTSVLNLPDRVLGLAVLRRELNPGDRVSVGDGPAMVLDLPFGPRDVEG